MQKKGTVYLVGAGPGDINLITVKGLRCIENADVILYDRLVNPSLLVHAKDNSELIYVGKSPGKHTMKQHEINLLMVRKANEGKSVARLKGGDPFIFGRGGEEAEFLAKNNISFEIVPGISSSVAAPAYAGIPITHRDMASSFAVITGHQVQNDNNISKNWHKIATWIDSLLFLMGVKNLPIIVENLLENGRTATEPVALIEWGTTSQQKTLIGNLGNIVDIAQKDNLTPPAIIVVGEVVSMREKLAWFEKKPLSGKRVVITRPRHQSESMAKLVTALGGEPFLFPTIEIIPPNDFTPMDSAIEKIDIYSWVIFSSVNGVEAFFERLRTLKKDIRTLNQIKFCCIGTKTEAALREYCLNVEYVPQQYTSESIVQGLKNKLQKDDRVLLPRSELASDILPNELEKIGISFDEVTAYRAVKPKVNTEIMKEFFKERGVDILTFTSSSTVTNFVDIIGGITEFEHLSKNVIVACIGPVTAQTAKEYKIPVHIVAEEYTVEGLMEAILEMLHFSQKL